MDKNHSIDGHAIMCTSERRKEYPEVTGYYIPTLLRWGYRVLALNYAEWLLQVQKKMAPGMIWMTEHHISLIRRRY